MNTIMLIIIIIKLRSAEVMERSFDTKKMIVKVSCDRVPETGLFLMEKPQNAKLKALKNEVNEVKLILNAFLVF